MKHAMKMTIITDESICPEEIQEALGDRFEVEHICIYGGTCLELKKKEEDEKEAE